MLDPSLLRDQGVEPTEFDFIVLKSAVHFRSNFTEILSSDGSEVLSSDHAIVEVTGPGIHSSRIADFVYERVSRPLWPLDLEEQLEEAVAEAAESRSRL